MLQPLPFAVFLSGFFLGVTLLLQRLTICLFQFLLSLFLCQFFLLLALLLQFLALLFRVLVIAAFATAEDTSSISRGSKGAGMI